jgi:hypothetical protein
MLKHTPVKRLMLLLSVAGLFAVSANIACLEDVCGPDSNFRTGAFLTLDEVMRNRIQTLDEALGPSGLGGIDRSAITDEGTLSKVKKLDRPVKLPNGKVVMPAGWLPEIPEGHPWRAKLTPSDDAFYSFVEERIIGAKLYDPSNPEHVSAVRAYLDKVNSSSPEFAGWTYATRTECAKKSPKKDAAPDGEAMM